MLKRKRIDAFMRHFMRACASVSILTTIGLVLILGGETLRFFGTREYVGTNKAINAYITAEETLIRTQTRGRTLTVGNVIRIGEELMLIEAVDVELVTVTRGYDGTRTVAHDAGERIDLAETISLGEFFTGTVWQPQIGEFGMLPLLTATASASVIAMLVATPLGLGSAIYLSEYASRRVRATIKPVLEILAGIPTVVYGFFALTFMTPVLRSIFGADAVQVYNVASAGLVMGVMILPTISSMCEDALSAVPQSIREASYGLAATKRETVFHTLLPSAFSGIVAAVLLGISRAIGETMIVAIAAGAGPRLTLNPFESAETITGHIARISTGDLSFGSIDYNSLFALAFVLLVFTLIFNIIAGVITRRFREEYQ